MARRSQKPRKASTRSFRGASEAREPGIQKHIPNPPLDFGSGADAPSRNDGAVSEKIRVARIGAAHGIRGEVKLWSFTEDPLAVAQYGPLQSEDGARQFEIETVRPGKDFLVARIAGVTDRNAAETLRNIDLFVPRDRLPPLDEADTFYHADLIGLAAEGEDGEALGTVIAIHNFGAGDIVEIAPEGGGATLMLPFNETTVPLVDLKAKQIVVVLPDESSADETNSDSSPHLPP